jgi:non-heme chloroperoxidase
MKSLEAVGPRVSGMQRIVAASLIVAMVLVMGACAGPDEATPATSEHAGVRLVTVAPNVRLEVVDWGGSGAPMVYLVGMGMEASNYERFASRFRDKHHVYGVNRRGAGASSTPPDGYDAATRAHDIIVVLDSLHIDKAILVGHSFAGDELSKLGVAYAARVRALVYLDAYDHPRRPGPENMPPLPPQATNGRTRRPTHRDSLLVASLEAADTDTTARPPVINSDSLARAGAEPADYSKITVPALAIYAERDTTAAQLFGDDYQRFDARNRAMAQRVAHARARLVKEDRDRFRTQVRRGTVLVIPGASHFVYDSNPDEVERAMRAFLAMRY